MITIVTDRIYILTDKINYITIDEDFEKLKTRSGSYVDVPIYKIIINFVPVTNSRNDYMVTEIKSYGRKRSISLFRDLVKQIREQCPDQLYLDQALDNLLGKEIEDDAGADEVCKLREEERRSKKVLRGAKRSK